MPSMTWMNEMSSPDKLFALCIARRWDEAINLVRNEKASVRLLNTVKRLVSMFWYVMYNFEIQVAHDKTFSWYWTSKRTYMYFSIALLCPPLSLLQGSCQNLSAAVLFGPFAVSRRLPHRVDSGSCPCRSLVRQPATFLYWKHPPSCDILQWILLLIKENSSCKDTFGSMSSVH